MAFIGPSLLACIFDPLASRVQGLPVKGIGLLFAIITAGAVVTMVKVVGALLVTALLVTPAATAQIIGNSFRSCLLWTQFFGITSLLGGLIFRLKWAGSGGIVLRIIVYILQYPEPQSTPFLKVMKMIF